ncbi:toxin-activating lysine-acyltransferase [Sagittula sp. NFXS13]|uniref:toxin-activating lysine-acyltransferase n=1 Tax=Sagittula sp. NFXS13 TaxID=2819095 RepID=UPI0032E02B12
MNKLIAPTNDEAVELKTPESGNLNTGDAAPQPQSQSINPAFITLLGEITFLALQSPLHRRYALRSLDARFVVPVRLDQYRMYRVKAGPLAVATWAYVSDEMDARLREGDHALSPDDWQSGDNLWIMELIIPFGRTDEVIEDLRRTVLKGRDATYRAYAATTGESEIKVLKAEADD